MSVRQPRALVVLKGYPLMADGSTPLSLSHSGEVGQVDSATSLASALCETDRVTEGTWLVIGVQASGKSTVADLLAHQFERVVHIHGGQFYRWAVTGWVHPWSEDSKEAGRFVDLRYRLSALAANEYCDAGFRRLSRTISTVKTYERGFLNVGLKQSWTQSSEASVALPPKCCRVASTRRRGACCIGMSVKASLTTCRNASRSGIRTSR